MNFTLFVLSALLIIVNVPLSPQLAYSQSVETQHEFLYGCTQYVPMIHCDPIVNEFESYQVKGNYSNILSATREPEFIAGKNGQAVHISANALEFISIDNSSQFANNAFTIYDSFNLDVDQDSVGSLISYTNSPHDAGWSIDVEPTEEPSTRLVKFSIFGNNSGDRAEAKMTVPMYTFVDIAATFDGKSLALYLNKTLKSMVSFSGNYAANPGENIPLKFAGGSYCSCDTLSVMLDEVQYYNRALLPEEIVSITTTDTDPELTNQGLVGHWKFDGDIKDYSGFDNNGFYNTLISNMAFSPDGRLFYTEKNSGKIRIVDTKEKLLQQPFAIIPDIYVDWEQGLLGLAIDSEFTSNHFLYVYYNYKDEETGQIFARI